MSPQRHTIAVILFLIKQFKNEVQIEKCLSEFTRKHWETHMLNHSQLKIKFFKENWYR